MIWGVTALLFASALSLLLAWISFTQRDMLRRRDSLRRRLQALGNREDAAQAAVNRLMRDNSLSSIPLLHRLLSHLPRTSSLRRLLQQAGSPCNLGALVLLSSTLAVLFGLGGSLQGSGWLSLGLGLLGMMLPFFWLRFLRSRRLKAFDVQFPEAVDLASRALRAGHSFGSALNMVAQEMDDPVAEEFGRTFADYSYGKSMEDALLGLVDRVELQDLKFFATAVTLQRETGGNLTEILDNIGYIIRERFRLLRQIRALSAEGRLSGTILALTAPALLVVLWYLSPDYTKLLFDHPTGNLMLTVGAIFQVLGVLVIRKLVRMKV